MNILIDIGHPAHVHLFKHFAWEMQKKGHKVFFTCREKEFEIYLLEKYGFPYSSFGKKYKTSAGKLWGLIEFDVKEFLAGLKFKPDLFLSHGSIYAAHTAFLLRKPHIALEDTGNKEQVKLYLPFTKTVLTPESFHKNYGSKQISYPGYHALAYLYPKRFPHDTGFLENQKLKPKSYVLLRFINWKASHDYGIKGIPYNDKIFLINKFSKKFKVFVSSESELSSEFDKYKLRIPPEKMHDFISHAFMLFGESGTMTSEAAILGVPAIQISGLQKGTMGTLAELERYGLAYIYEKYTYEAERKIEEIINTDNIAEIWETKRQTMLSDKIDVTGFFVWFIENYPNSIVKIKNNSNLFKFFK